MVKLFFIHLFNYQINNLMTILSMVNYYIMKYLEKEHEHYYFHY